MANQDVSIYEKLLTDVKIYIELQLDYMKLTTADKASSAVANLILAIMLVILLIFLFLYGNIFWAIALGWYFESYLIGFAAFTGGYFLLIIFLLLLWSPLRRAIRNRFVDALVDNDFSSPKKS
ncbi:MAG: hypothetical protein JNM36_16330 [Chitinophagales bacterium]|nr:hypothetical protein [Chitinophagales bacterium]